MRHLHTLLLSAIVLAFTLITAPLFASPKTWERAIEAFEKADAAHPVPRGAVVFVGSSSIVKWTSLSQDFAGIAVINRGFGGCELADCAYYASRIVIPYRPRMVVLYAGDNDVAAGKSPAVIAAAFRDFTAKVHTALPNTPILFLAVKPSPSRWHLRQQIEGTNALISQECARYPWLRFVDVYHPMLNAEAAPRPELFTPDMLHMNADGYALWRSIVLPLVESKMGIGR